MNSSTWLISLLCALAMMTACGPEPLGTAPASSTATTPQEVGPSPSREGPVSSESALPTATLPPTSVPQSPTSRSERKASDHVVSDPGDSIQRLFDTWAEAFQTQDAGLLRSTLTRDLAARCELGALKPWIEQIGPNVPAFEVTSVFFDTNNPDKALAELVAKPENEEHFSALRPESAFVMAISSFPYPVEQEDGEWRAGFHSIPDMPSFCPFAALPPPVGLEEEDQFPNIPGLEFRVLRDISPVVDRTPGSLGSLDKGGKSGALNGTYLIEAYGLIESTEEPGGIVSLYRNNLEHSSWEIQDEGAGGDAAWFTWTVRDDRSNLWNGSLVAVAMGEGFTKVSLFLHSPDLR